MPLVKLAFLDVGQGDTTVISCPETQEAIVVDCVNSISVLEYFKRESIKLLRGVIITHLHADHYQQVANLLYNCVKEVGTQGCEVLVTTEGVVNPTDLRRQSVRKKWPPDNDGHSVVYEQLPVVKSALAKLYRWCKENDEKCLPSFAIPGHPFPIKGTIAQNLQILHPPYIDYQELRMSGLNNISIVLRVIGTSARALLTGDLEPEGWQYLKGKYPDLRSDVLKFPHHGGTWEENEANDLIATVKPSIVVISVGSNNSFNHPHPGVFASLSKQNNIRLLCTQATDKCQQSVQNEHDNVILKFQAQSRKDDSFFIPRKRGQCPCAGTVIIELGDEPRVVQPDLNFHESIINAHYHDRKCSIGYTAPSTTMVVEATQFSTDT